MLRINFAIFLCVMVMKSYGQTFGIGTDFPQATLHVVNSEKKTAIRIDIKKEESSFGLEINQMSLDYASVTVMDSNYIAHYTDLTTSGGIGNTVNLEGKDGGGYFVYNLDLANPNDSSSTGDGYLYDGFAYSFTPPSGSETFGGIYGGDQYGNSIAMHLNQWGATESNTLLFTFNAANPEPTLRIGDSGYGGGLYVSNDNDNPPLGTLIDVSQFYYLGNDNTLNHTAVYGDAYIEDGVGIGIWGSAGAFGVIGEAPNLNPFTVGPNFGVYALGDLGASGEKTFFIDLPSDPENYFLKHFSIESNEALNIYRGNAILGRSGRVAVKLPEYFEDVNTNYTYQLTSIESSIPAFIARKVVQGVFIIGGKPGAEVSWMVMAERNDPYFAQSPERRENLIPKSELYQGKYLHPELYNQAKSKGIFYRPVEESKEYQRIHRSNLYQNISSERLAFPEVQPLQIEQEIKTWDELEIQ